MSWCPFKYKLQVMELKNICCVIDQVLKWPSDEDLNGAAVALMRLQDTYQVEPQDLADGVLKGFRAGVELTANDCFELGRQNYNNGEQRDRPQ